MMDIAKEFGYKTALSTMAWSVQDRRPARARFDRRVGVGRLAHSLEAADAVRANMALIDHAGARTIVHSDDASGEQRLNQEAAKGMAEGNRIGVAISEDEAIKWLTINPAWALGLDDKIGTIEAGKNADVVLWSSDPFSVYSRAEKVWIDGAMLFDRLDPAQRWRTDFELGFVPDVAGGNR